MSIQRKVEKDGLIVTRFGGTHTYKDAVKALHELAELNQGKKGIYEIVINDDDIRLKFNREEQELLAGEVLSAFSRFSFGTLAVVANSDLAFGLSRVLEMSIKNERIPVAVFRSERLAREWIAEIRKLREKG